jgi:hypothetical protein
LNTPKNGSNRQSILSNGVNENGTEENFTIASGLSASLVQKSAPSYKGFPVTTCFSSNGARLSTT